MYGRDDVPTFNAGATAKSLLPGYSFNAYLVAGLTPIIAGGPLDFFIDRPEGMKGYILNLTIKGQGRIFSGKDGEETLDSKPGELLLFFLRRRVIIMVVLQKVTAGITVGSIFVLARTGPIG